MVRRFLGLLVVLGLGLANAAHAKDASRILIFPFQIHAQEDMAYLETEIPQLIGRFLTQEGAVVEVAEPGPLAAQEGLPGRERIRELAMARGADYAIWGSLTWVGQQYSMDAHLMEAPAGAAAITSFAAEGEGIETISETLQRLTRQIGQRIFRQERILAIEVAGNQRIEAEAIKRVIQSQPGDIFNPRKLAEDLNRIYQMGYFEDIRIEAQDTPRGMEVTFVVEERPSIRYISIFGNRAFEEDEIKENLGIRTGSILNLQELQESLKRIETLYKEQNYHNVAVDYELEPLDTNQVDVDFTIEEGDKLRIREIDIVGNAAYPDKKIKGLMETSEKGFFSWLTSSGDLNMEDLQQDVNKIVSFYQNNGYIQARVGDPLIEYRDEWIYITIKIDEGPRFQVGKVDFSGDLVFPAEELREKIRITQEAYFNREVLRRDVLTITDLYADIGYAYAEVLPSIQKDFDNLVVNIDFSVQKNSLVYFEKILITGNTKTRDKVIRRELNIYEKELYSGRALKRAVRNLHRLDYFEDIKVDTLMGSAEDEMILKIDVTEKPTGTFSFGAGYSSLDSFFAAASISQRNLFGRGQILRLKAELGGKSQRFTLGFTEPWLFDIPLAAGFDLYNWTYEYDDYEKDSRGGSLRFSYPVFDFTRAYLSYSYDYAEITDIQFDAPISLQDFKGKNVTSSLGFTLKYDSRDQVFTPTEGSEHSFSVEFAGGPLGGDIAFTKYIAETGWYIPLYKELRAFLHGKTGFVEESSGGELPVWERFYLGGINSLRGFDRDDLSPKDETGAEIGGDKFVQFNFELLFPLVKQAGLVGVVFLDTGDVYDNGESIDLGNLRESAGVGFRWYSPIGPIRVEYGHILDPKEGEGEGGRWEFTMGAAF